MSELVDKRICRYFNAASGCWYGEKCKFLHISDQKPLCKFFNSTGGCRFGENCHFSHDVALFQALEAFTQHDSDGVKEDYKENMNPRDYNIGTNNNSMTSQSASPDVKTIVDGVEVHVKESSSGREKDATTTAHENIATSVGSNALALSSTSSTAGGAISHILESDYRCGSCKRPVIAQGNESYYNLLKDHYLECFMSKEGEHVKYVKFKAALEPGQMYWCKTCILVFEKPWSLFQHMGDKATGSRLPRWEKKSHMDWLDTVAGLMAGHDLGLFNSVKLRGDLRNLLSDRRTMEEEMENAALSAAAAMLQLFSNPAITNPGWRGPKRDGYRPGEYNRFSRRGGFGGQPPMMMGSSFPNGPGNRYYADRYSSGRGRLNTQSNTYNVNTNNTNSAGCPTLTEPNNTTGEPTSGAPTNFRFPQGPESGSGDSPSTEFTCGFTEDEVNELLSHGIRPWDSEAAAALSALRGEMDHLLE